VQVAGEADYGPLLEAGVRIWHYERTMLHAKVLTVDGAVACVGSGNFDQRSMRLNDEANIVVLHPGTVDVLDGHFDEDLTSSREIDAASWAKRGPVQRAAEAASEIIDRKL
jgi:cardiolipin synthase A/B